MINPEVRSPRLEVRGSKPEFPGQAAAFSLVELLTVMALLSVIILGLMAMFTQTQRAFRTGMSQTDVLESGRVVTDLIARDLSQISPNYVARSFGAPNFYEVLMGAFPLPLPGVAPDVFRTNFMDDVFFVVRKNQSWSGIGYFVRTNLDGLNANTGVGTVGTLYRFETNASLTEFQQNPSRLLTAWSRARVQTNYPGVSRILDGVVSFSIRPRDDQGWVFTNNPVWQFKSPSLVVNSNLQVVLRSSGRVIAGSFLTVQLPGAELYLLGFYSNSVPASVEFQLGILEQQAFDRYKGIPIFQSQTNYLASQAARVHLFRQLIAVPNVDPAAYQ